MDETKREDRNTLQTAWGVLHGIDRLDRREDGTLESVTLNEENRLSLPEGSLVPNFTFEAERKKYRPSLEFYPDGSLKSIYLENPQTVRLPWAAQGKETVAYDGVSVPAVLKAELLTFYPDGNLCRLFPTYGRITGYWSEEDERKMAEKISLKIFHEKTELTVRCYHFYPEGRLQSLTIGLGEKLTVPTRYGKIQTSVGISLYPSGSLSSVEPDPGSRIRVDSQTYLAFDLFANRIHADQNSCRFREDGKILSLVTTGRRKIEFS